MVSIKSYNSSSMTTGVALLLILTILVLFIGWVANICQVIAGMTLLKSITSMSGLLLFKTVAIFLGPVGSIFGLVGMFH